MTNTTSPIIILHGWGSAPTRWNTFVTALKKTLTDHHVRAPVYVPELPGFDPADHQSYTLENYEKWLKTYLHRHTIRQITLVGHSNGGRIAIYFASRNPSMVAKLVLIGAAGVSDHTSKNTYKIALFQTLAKKGSGLIRALGLKRIENISRSLLHKIAGSSDYLKATPAMRKTMKNMLAYRAESDLVKIQCKAMCVWGESDTATPVWMGKVMCSAIKDCDLHVLEGGHTLYRENPEKVASLLVDFIST